ncbi:FMN-binding protein [Clostridium sp. SM-530-WT-3G]|uniref:FMN-binding protein n=1 Tax=Clostridium sp. SM-530-WT-3G TaxID=2725303 RepID=UPI00145FB830|nr:FMN-binding protein [Clostridium sp. SM-530-WT-3G]NME82011.1 FMN-binding protein [Clostridium sp. SM-530-WT-3G]
MKSYLIKSIITVCVAVAVAWGGYYLYNISKYQKTVKALQIQEVNLNNIQDGKYKGSFDANVISAEVEVAVKNHKIENINLINHKTDRGKKAEVIIDDVIKKQTVKVDTISGATNSSKVILKAIQNALDKKIH